MQSRTARLALKFNEKPASLTGFNRIYW